MKLGFSGRYILQLINKVSLWVLNSVVWDPMPADQPFHKHQLGIYGQ